MSNPMGNCISWAATTGPFIRCSVRNTILKGDVMRIRRLAVPIAITSALVVLGGVTAGLIWAWSPAPSSVQSNLQAANPRLSLRPRLNLCL